MAVEKARGCGYRKVNGLYLVGDVNTVALCDRLPYKIDNCPVCSSGLKFSRGWSWIDWQKYAGEHGSLIDALSPERKNAECRDDVNCPICWPSRFVQPYGLIWVGEKFYTPDAFVRESLQLGISRRIPFTGSIPRMSKNLKLGETWILFAHKHVIKVGKDALGKDLYEPAIFHSFRPTRLELLLWESEAVPERLLELEKAGITPIIIPNGDKDHDPDSPLGLPEEEKEELESDIAFNDLRNKLHKKQALEA
jgi:hypothetical protein